MIWWRVELDKTGAILRVEEVAKREKDGRLVCYVEAVDKAKACSEAKQWHRRRLDSVRKHDSKRRAIADALWICRFCRLKPRVTAHSCRACADLHNERRRLRRAGLLPSPRRRSAEEMHMSAIERARERRRRNPEYGYVWWLRLFDELGPEKFRAWLVLKIEEKRAEAAPEPLMAEAAE